MQVIGVQAMIRDVPEARIDQRGVLVIAFVQQTMYKHGKLIVQLFVGVGGVCSAWCFGMKKGLQNSEGLCIHDGGDEGDRTPDLLTASQALSQLSYAPVTRRYYRGMFTGMQEVFVETFSYGFSWDGAELTDFDFGKISQLTHRPDKTLTQEKSDCDALVDLDRGC